MVLVGEDFGSCLVFGIQSVHAVVLCLVASPHFSVEQVVLSGL